MHCIIISSLSLLKQIEIQKLAIKVAQDLSRLY